MTPRPNRQRDPVQHLRSLAVGEANVLGLKREWTARQGHAVRGLDDLDVQSLYADDGLPASWKQKIVDFSTTDSIISVSQVLPGDDFDHDGLIASMVGRKIESLYPATNRAIGEPRLTVRGLKPEGAAAPMDFEVRAGEIVGIAGLLGSGRSEILGAIYGSLPHAGQISMAGKLLRGHSPAAARMLGIELLTEDRKHEGLFFNLPAGQNVTIGNLGTITRRGVIDKGREMQVALERMRALNVKASSPFAAVAHLSGGNQQKLLFARALLSKPRLLLLDEPTKGVDAATRQEIYRLLGELADAGVALIIASSELEELIGLADRCLVVAHGRIVDSFARGEGGEERVLRASVKAGS